MSVLKFAHYKVHAQGLGVSLIPVKGMVNTYVATHNGVRTYLFSDEEVIQYVNAL